MNVMFPVLNTLEVEIFFLIVLLGLASYRTSLLVVEDELFRPIREFIWKKFPPERSLFGYFFTCMKCTSVWAALIWLTLFLIFPLQATVIAVVLSISAIVVIIDSALKR